MNCDIGFDTWYYQDSDWENCKAVDCTESMLAQNDNTTRMLSMNKCSKSPTGYLEDVVIQNIPKNNSFSPLLSLKKLVLPN
ncbi:MAG: hypothetical protein AAF600_10070 [Bacteroidota bacterium]